MRIRWSRQIIPILALVLAASASPGSARDQEQPTAATLQFRGHSVQRGSPVSSCWTWVSGDHGVGSCVEYASSWPSPVSLVGSNVAAARLRWPIKPSSVRMTAWALIDPTERPVGPGMDVPYSLVERHRRSAWDVRFATGMACRHHYVSLHADWAREDSPQSYGEAGWRFHYVNDLAANGQRLDCTV